MRLHVGGSKPVVGHISDAEKFKAPPYLYRRSTDTLNINATGEIREMGEQAQCSVAQ